VRFLYPYFSRLKRLELEIKHVNLMYCIQFCFKFHSSSFSEKCAEVIQVFIISCLSIRCTFENVLVQIVGVHHLILLGCSCIKRHQPTHIHMFALFLVHLFFLFFFALGTRLFRETVPNNLSSGTLIFKRLIIFKFCVDIYIYIFTTSVDKS